jgi:hypothetical protein
MIRDRASQATRVRVNRWCAFYTRGLVAEAAADRRDELDADVFDQVSWSTSAGLTDRAISRAILWRAIKGVPADLAWRRAQLRAANSASIGTRVFAGWLMLGATVLGLGMIVIALTAVVRDRHDVFAGEATGIPPLVAALAIAAGLVLLFRRRTRWLGALWIAVGAPVVAVTGVGLLATTTTVLERVTQSTPLWSAGQAAVAVVLVVFYSAASVWWMPERKRTRSR